MPSYLVDWVSSFLCDRKCTLVFQGSPNMATVVSVGTPQGCPLSRLLFLIYVVPLHFAIPKGLMVSYVDDFLLTVASPSHRTNIRRLQNHFLNISRKASRLNVSFSFQKTELIHWHSPSERSPTATSPITLDGPVFHPASVVRWLGYWLSPALNTSHHFNYGLSLAQASFSFVRSLSSPGEGVGPFLAHHVAQGLLLPILAYGAYLLTGTPNTRTLQSMNSFWHCVCRWVTNSLFSTPVSIQYREACLPALGPYCRHR